MAKDDLETLRQEFLAWARQLQMKNPDLYKQGLELLRKLEKAYTDKYGRFPMGGSWGDGLPGP